MTIRRVLRAGHPRVRESCEPYPAERLGSEELDRLIEDMFDTMRDYRGAGLAAPQVQEPYRVLVYELQDNDRYEDVEDTIPPTVLINPTIVESSDETLAEFEGCLSLPDLRGEVVRPTSVTIRALNRDGETVEKSVEGFEARIVQHEIDHLEGTLFVDRIDDMETLSFLDEYREYHAGDGAT